MYSRMLWRELYLPFSFATTVLIHCPCRIFAGFAGLDGGDDSDDEELDEESEDDEEEVDLGESESEMPSKKKQKK